MKQFTYGNGIVHTLDQNLRGLPDRSKDAYAGTAVLDDSYDYDNYGNVAAISDGLPGAPGNRSMSYDGLDRLKSATSSMWGGTINYTYDVLDNIETLVAPAYGAQPARNLRYCYKAGRNTLEFIRSGATNCTTGSATTTFEFDDPIRLSTGNVWKKNQQEYAFTQDNRLRDVVGKEKYRYDANGRRVTAEHATLGFIRSFYNKGGQLSFQADARQQKNFAYVYLAGSLVATREQSTSTGVAALKYNHTDGLGTPVAVTNSSRAVLEQRQYEPYGRLTNLPIHDGPGYTGHLEDAQTGLTYMQQRYYDPQIGRFLSADPVAANANIGSNFNRYWYANNTPYNFIDPDGRAPKGPHDMDLCSSGIGDCDSVTIAPDPPARSDEEVARRASSQLSYYGTPSANQFVRRWKLDRPTASGGWIVQHVQYYGEAFTEDGERQPIGSEEYWEAWEVKPGKDVATPNSDRFRAYVPTRFVRGTVTWKAKAAFFGGISKPNGFSRGAVRQAGNLESSYADPNLDWSQGSAPVLEAWTYTWP